MLTPRQLFSSQLWLSTDYYTKSGLLILMSIATASFLSGIIFKYLQIKKPDYDLFVRKLYRKLSNLLITLSLLSYMFIFCAAQNVLFFRSRLWYLVILIIGLVWLFFIYRFWTREVPRKREERDEKIQREKYLPKRK